MRESNGQPILAGSPEGKGLKFNLTNTQGLVACVVTKDRDVGIDAEHIHRAAGSLDIAGRFFAPTEVQALRAFPAEEQTKRFFDIWTPKESYIKARGLGPGPAA